MRAILIAQIAFGIPLDMPATPVPKNWITVVETDGNMSVTGGPYRSYAECIASLADDPNRWNPHVIGGRCEGKK